MAAQTQTFDDGETKRSRWDLDAENSYDTRGPSARHFQAQDGRAATSARTRLADRLHEDQEHAEDIAELMRLKDTDPQEFDKYVQMAEDATKLASERPEMFKAIMRDNISDSYLGEGGTSPAWQHQKRALHAASQLSRADGDTGFGDNAGTLNLNIPRKRAVGPGGSQEKKQQGIFISPEPGFVIKTRSLEDGVKVFVNVCQNERIGDSGFVKKLDKDGNEVDGLNIPMSVGPPCVDQDNAGEECIVYDVIINPQAIDECRSDKTGARRDWLCHLAMQSVMAKHACQLDPKYKLPKLKFKGDKETGPAPQRIRDDSTKPRISELSQSSDPLLSYNKLSTAENGKGMTTTGTTIIPSSEGTKAALSAPITTALWKHGSCGDVEREMDVGSQSLEESVRSSVDEWPDSLQVSVIGLPQGILASESFTEVGITASSYEVTVQAVGCQPLQLRLPYTVLPNTASAQANRHQGTLVVSIMVDKTPIWRGPDAGSKPWLLAHALGGTGSRQVSPPKIHGKLSSQSDVEVGKCAQVERKLDMDAMPEDSIHLNLPRGMNPSSGAEAYMDVRDNRSHEEDTPLREGDSLPEDRFHKADIVSRHAIDTREHQRREKIQRAEEERDAKNARRKDPQEGTEYIDFDECHSEDKSERLAIPCPVQPIKLEGQDAPLNEGSVPSQDMSTAARVLSDAVNEQDIGGAEFSRRLSAPGWTELLD